MKRNRSNQFSSYGKNVVLRIRQKEYMQLSKHMQKDIHNEQMAFGLGIHEQTANGTVFMLNELQ